ncbi:alpha/beta-hydrolase [Cryphonectria parasitica EP155]|uniref:Alpha/beta-hydrolase n=1 Tax=Cryphonectria parasitica (strain ATCC 38755 / EP155) TaxID=660469 RepID=A0A9P4Y2Z4_CRYP1|nr:alpha/beta-hydrolase [Cryphonectria parasitica EP155]KAF3765210.1 alpha/beta-hydrolase [Cryphonectria parasitica EP155]
MTSSSSSPIRSCPDCFTGTIHTAQPVGHVEILHDVPTYITRGEESSSSLSAPAPSNSTIVFLTDGFGTKLVNNKLLADQYAARTGLRVLVPDLLPGGGVPLVMLSLSATLTRPVAWYNLLGQIRRVWAAARLMSILLPFSFRVRRLYPAVLGYVRAVRASLPLGAKLGLAGFCLGGHWSSRICGASAVEGDGDDDGNDDSAGQLVDAHFTAHPSSVAPDEFAAFARRFRVPFSLALGDRDQMMSVEQAHEVEASLRGVFEDEPERLEVRLYEKCGHGFALRADPNETGENEGAERALEQAVNWFRKFLN